MSFSSLESSPVLGESQLCIRVPGGAGWVMRPSTKLAVSVATRPSLSLPRSSPELPFHSKVLVVLKCLMISFDLVGLLV